MVLSPVSFLENVKDYIQEAKAHMSQTYQDMEAGLSLSSHYVDVQVSQREVVRSGKNTNKCLDKELVIKGDTDRQKTMLALSQVGASLLLNRLYHKRIKKKTLLNSLPAYRFPLRSLMVQMEKNPDVTFCCLAMPAWEKPL